jgi:hypothetical protein
LLVLWSRRRRPATFVSGVRREAGEVRGHAWLEAPDLDATLGGRASANQEYAEIFRWSNRWEPRRPEPT